MYVSWNPLHVRVQLTFCFAFSFEGGKLLALHSRTSFVCQELSGNCRRADFVEEHGRAKGAGSLLPSFRVPSGSLSRGHGVYRQKPFPNKAVRGGGVSCSTVSTFLVRFSERFPRLVADRQGLSAHGRMTWESCELFWSLLGLLVC